MVSSIVKDLTQRWEGQQKAFHNMIGNLCWMHTMHWYRGVGWTCLCSLHILMAIVYTSWKIYSSQTAWKIEFFPARISQNIHSSSLCGSHLKKWMICYILICRNTHIYTHLPYHNDSIIETDARRKRQEDFFNNILPLTLLQGFERVVQGLHVRGCWRPNINFIFWPHCYDRHVVSFLFS